MTTYVICRLRDTSSLRHCGRKTYRNFVLYIDGRVFETYTDDSRRHDYRSGRALDQFIVSEVNHMRKFFPGTLVKARLLDTSECI